MIKFKDGYENILQNLISDNKERLEFFFSHEKNAEYLETNNFDALFENWGVPFCINSLTALLIESNIDFLPYMSIIKQNMFADMAIESIKIPSNIKSIRFGAFSHDILLDTIEFDMTMDDVIDTLDTGFIKANSPVTENVIKMYLCSSTTTLKNTTLKFKK